MTSKKTMTTYALLMAALIFCYYTFPSLHLVFWTAIGVSSAAAVLAGTLANRPRSPLPWMLGSASLLIFTAGDATYLVLTDILGQNNPFPSLADVFYLGMYPILAAAVLLLPRSAGGRDRASVLDAFVLTGGLGLLAWLFLISPYVNNPDLTTLEKATSIAYPLCDVLVLVAGARLVAAARRTPAVALLAVGGVGLLAADVLYGLSQLHGDWTMGGPVDLGWVVFYSAWGAAALHPSMVSLTEPRAMRETEASNLRLAMLTVSALVAPAVLLVQDINGSVHDGSVIAVLSGLVFMLVLARLAGVVRVHRHAVGRERGLREAGEALVSATCVADVTAVVRAAVAKLLPPGRDHKVVFTVRGSPDAGCPTDSVAFVAGPTVPGPPMAAGRTEARFIPTRELAPAAASAMSGFELTLVRPLALDERPSGDPVVGELVVAADDVALETLSSAIEVLASQAALAIERINLNNEIIRRNSEEYFRTLVLNTADVILIIDDENHIRYASPSASGVLGEEDLTGRALREVIEPADRELAWQVLESVRAGRAGASIADWNILRRDGGLVQVEVSGRDLRHDATVRGLVITLRDVTEQRRLERELTHRAFHDSLTGLANRVLFQDRVQRAVMRARRIGSVVGVLFVDVDDFKVVNDRLGHEVGDQLLEAVGQKLSAALRSNDTAARLGGDEFAALIEDARDPQDVEQVAERLVKALAEPLMLGGSLINGSVSVGVATTVEAADERDLLRQADLALYVAKGAGKGRWRHYQPALHTALVERLELRSALDNAVTEGELELQYQPIVKLADGRTVGFEALVRWHHPTRGLVLPSQFIDVAEDSGLIVPIGEWVFATALRAAANWIRPGDPDGIYISINVSVRQFRAAGFTDKIYQELAHTGLPPQCLMLEITESLLLRDDEQVWNDLNALRGTGVRVAIDDFGTGYSSLSYLRQVPIDVVKIDKSFIDTMSASDQQRALVDGIVRLAHTLGLQVVAEGIERPCDRDLLVAIGCPLGQGFLYSGALSEDDARAWLALEEIAA